MVRRYKAEAYSSWECDIEFPEVRMIEAREGEFVSYVTFMDTTNQLRAEIARLKKQRVQRTSTKLPGDPG